jgi:hypothetical protein
MSSSTIPSVVEIKKWTSDYFLKNKHHWDNHDFVKSFTIDWFITNQHNEWIASERPFSSMAELVFGVQKPSDIKMISLAYGLHYYSHNYISDSPSDVKSPWQVYRNEPNVSDSLAMEIRKEYPGMPMHFINVSVAFLYKSVPQSVLKIAQISMQSVITFLMICNRMAIPPEIIHHILINLNIDTFTDVPESITFLNSGKDFSYAIEKVGKANIDVIRATRYYNITQVIDSFKIDC